MAIHHAVGMSSQKNSGYRPSKVNITAQGLFTSNSSLSPTHLSIRRGRSTTTHYTHHQVSLMVSRNTTLVPSWGCALGQPVWQASTWHVKGVCATPNKKERKKPTLVIVYTIYSILKPLHTVLTVSKKDNIINNLLILNSRCLFVSFVCFVLFFVMF